MKKIICLAFLGIAFQTSFAQLQWQKGGNNIGGGNNPYIGTSAAWNSFLQIGVSGSQDIFIDNLPGAFPAGSTHAGISELQPAQPGTGGPLLGGHWVGQGISTQHRAWCKP